MRAVVLCCVATDGPENCFFWSRNRRWSFAVLTTSTSPFVRSVIDTEETPRIGKDIKTMLWRVRINSQHRRYTYA